MGGDGRRREEMGAGGDNNMRGSLRSHGGWGIEGRSVIATQGEESEQSALSVCAAERMKPRCNMQIHCLSAVCASVCTHMDTQAWFGSINVNNCKSHRKNPKSTEWIFIASLRQHIHHNLKWQVGTKPISYVASTWQGGKKRATETGTSRLLKDDGTEERQRKKSYLALLSFSVFFKVLTLSHSVFSSIAPPSSGCV